MSGLHDQLGHPGEKEAMPGLHDQLGHPGEKEAMPGLHDQLGHPGEKGFQNWSVPVSIGHTWLKMCRRKCEPVKPA